MRLLIVASAINKFKPITMFLQKRGCQAIVVDQDPTRIFTKIVELKPDFILVSFNSKGISPLKLSQIIKSKTKAKVLGFAEESDSKTAGLLAASGLVDIIHAPVSGPVIFMKLQRLVSDMEEDFNQSNSEEPSQSWVPAAPANRPSKSEVKYHAGEESTSDQTTKENKLSLETILQKSGFSQVQGTTNFERKIHVSAIFIKSPQEQGYLIVAKPSGEKVSDQESTKLVAELTRSSMSVSVGDAMNLEFADIDFANWARKTGQFFLEKNVNGEMIYCFYIKRDKKLIEAGEKSERGLIGVSTLDFYPDQHIDFDIFIDLKLNKRALKFFRKGALVEGERLKKLHSAGHNELFLEPQEVLMLPTYDAKGFLNESLARLMSLPKAS